MTWEEAEILISKDLCKIVKELPQEQLPEFLSGIANILNNRTIYTTPLLAKPPKNYPYDKGGNI